MVNFAGSALVAILAATANAEYHRIGRRHIHPRAYSVAPPPVEYSTAPQVSETSAVQSVPEASGSQSVPYPSGPQSVPNAQPSGSAPSGPHTVPSAPSAPYGYGNTTIPYAPTGTGAISTPEVSISTATVVPVPETSAPGAGNGGNGGEQPTGGAPTNAVPSGLPGTTGAGEGVCGPATVTVTVTKNTVTVTAGQSSSAVVPPVGASSVPQGQSSAVVPPAGPSSVPVGQSSAVNSYPAGTPSSPKPSAPVESSPAESAPVASGSSKPSAPVASYPAGTPPKESSPATAPVASEHESQPAYTQKPETTSEVAQAPKPTSEVASAPVASSATKAGSSTASASKPSSSSSTGSGSYAVAGSKRGFIYQETSKLDAFGNGKCGWAWNWNGNNFGMEGDWNYVPIINSPAQEGTFATQAKAAIASAADGAKYVMGLNEPDQDGDGGSGVDVDTAVQNYIDYVVPFKKQGASLGSISVTSDQTEGANKGLTYLENWKKACDAKGSDACPVDFVCLHYYGDETKSGEEQAEDFKTYMEKAVAKVHDLWSSDMKIWLTEVSAKPYVNADPEGKNIAFMKSVLPYLDDHKDVDRYAYFMASPGYMIDDNGEPTEAGSAYLSI